MAASLEPLLDIKNDRYMLFPIAHHDIWTFYKKQLSSMWTNEEIDYTQDIVDWQTKLNDGERHFISHVLAFFASSDSIIIENLCVNFAREVAYPEARMAYSAQQFFEAIHTEGYGLIIDTLIKDRAEKEHLFRAIETIPCVAKKAAWAEKWITSDASFAMRLAAFAIVEGVMFSASFCAIFWLKTRGLLPGLAFLNALISRDEGMHVDFAVLLYTKHLNHRLDEETMHALVKEAVEIEVEFVTVALDVRTIGMNAALMTEYVQYVADHLLESMGYERIYGARMVFDYMHMISVENKSNFFEARVSEYQLASIAGGSREFSVDVDF